MPHFLASSVKLPTLPFECDGFCFVYEAIQNNDPLSSLLLVRYNDIEFLLRKIQRPNNVIVKCEKSTKSQPTGIIKNALNTIMRLQDSLISHNLNNNSLRQNLHSPYIRSMDFVLHLPYTRLQGAIIEVGFGSGRHLLHIAKQNPTRLCLGIEIHTPSIEQVARQIELLGLTNLYIIRGDARILLEIFPSQSAHRIFVHFPVPWNKKPHRRIFSHKFLKESLRVLESGAILHLRSDDWVYFYDSLMLVLQNKYASFEVKKNNKQEITSKYEARWERQEKDIYDLYIQSNSTPSPFTQTWHSSHVCTYSKTQIKSAKNFSFDKILRKNLDNYAHFPYKKVAHDWFLHIDSLYCAKDIYVLALCFGDFNQPQSKFLHIDFAPKDSYHTNAYYINGEPLPTCAALNAHEHLLQILTQE